MVPHNLIGQLALLADVEVDHALLNGVLGFVSRPTSEPGFVAAVVRGAIPGIATQWAPIFRTARIKFSIVGVGGHALDDSAAAYLKTVNAA